MSTPRKAPRGARAAIPAVTKAFIAGAVLYGNASQSDMVKLTGVSSPSVSTSLSALKRRAEVQGIHPWEDAAYDQTTAPPPPAAAGRASGKGGVGASGASPAGRKRRATDAAQPATPVQTPRKRVKGLKNAPAPPEDDDEVDWDALAADLPSDEERGGGEEGDVGDSLAEAGGLPDGVDKVEPDVKAEVMDESEDDDVTVV